MSETKSKIVRADSKARKSGGYGFSYASLSDIAKAGFKIPKMRIKPTDDGRQFIEYKDGDDWLLGAEIITEFKGEGMNDCQAYGSALTYARRYTAQLALGLAVDDDKNVETAGAEQRSRSSAKAYTDKPATDKQIATIKNMLGSGAEAVLKHNQPLTIGKASKLITAISARLTAGPADQEHESAEKDGSEITAEDLTEPIDIADIPF